MLLKSLTRLHTDALRFTICSLTSVVSIRSRLRHYSTGGTSESQYEEFFKYTGGRWIHNEAQELAKRYHHFNVDALKAVAAEAAGATAVLSMRKLTEGEFNKAFLMSLDNGKEVIARLPLPKAGPGLVTASEVATMDYVRSRLQIPTPRVLSSSSDASNNSVESAYIIMEKAEGIELGEVWDDLTIRLKCKVALQIVELEKCFMKPMSGGYGALYYRGDIDPSMSRDFFTDGVREEDFVLGPMTPTSFWRDGKADMDIDRGPWTTLVQYNFAVANRERDWINKHAVAQEYNSSWDPPTFKKIPADHIALLDRLITVIPYLVPSEPALLQPSLVHRDINIGNVFISKELLDAGEIKITSIIDWQHTAVLPLICSVRMPAFLDLPAVDVTPSMMESTTILPRDKLIAYLEDKLALEEYTRASKANNPVYFNAYNFPTRSLLLGPILHAGLTWQEHFFEFRESLFQLIENWDVLETGVPCPIRFSDEEWSSREAELAEWKGYQDLQNIVDVNVGVHRGKVSVDKYDEAVEKNKKFMETVIETTLKEQKDLDEAHRELMRSVFPLIWMYRPWET